MRFNPNHISSVLVIWDLLICLRTLLYPYIESSVTWLDWDEAFYIQSLLHTHTSLSIYLCVVCCLLPRFVLLHPLNVQTSVENGFEGSGVYCSHTFAVWSSPATVDIWVHWTSYSNERNELICYVCTLLRLQGQ